MRIRRTVKLILKKLYKEYIDYKIDGIEREGLCPIKFLQETNIRRERIDFAMAFLIEREIIEKIEWPQEKQYKAYCHHLSYPKGVEYFRNKQYNQDFSWWSRMRITDRVRAIKDIVTLTASILALFISVRTCNKISDNDQSGTMNNAINKEMPTAEKTDNTN